MKNTKEAFEQYVEKMHMLEDDFKENDYDENKLEELREFQRNELQEWLEDFNANSTSEYKDIVNQMMTYVINDSEAGNSIIALCDFFEDDLADNEEFANVIADAIFDELGDFMLEYPQVYRDIMLHCYVIDGMFGGYFTPNWDGWYDDYDDYDNHNDDEEDDDDADAWWNKIKQYDN